MKSSTGKYYVGLDHIRGIAAFMVFTWHFVHINNGHLAAPPYFPLSLLTEGHTGVALFMTLSGYLFAKLLAGKNIKFRYFIWNRFLRLAPLLFLVVFIVGVQLILAGLDPLSYAKFMFLGVIKPVLPNGGWSITVEFHFYLILPLLLFMSRKSSGLLMLFVVGAILLRLFFYVQDGSVQNLAYLTIIGRIDQFVFGILAYQYRDFFKGRHLLALAIFLGFSAFFWYFDSLGGFYKSSSYPSPSSVWIYMTTVEGIVYASLIAWYDNSFNHSSGRFSRFLALVGTYSYSIYLLHFFFVFELAKFIDAHVISLSNYYLSMLFAPLAFLVMIPFGWASYRFVESPFLKFRTWYILADKS